MDLQQRYYFDPKTDLLGQGEFSKTYKANDIFLERFVALKFFSRTFSGGSGVRYEMKKVMRFEHPNLCKYYDITVLPISDVDDGESIEVGIIEFAEAGDLVTFCRNNPYYLDKLLVDVLRGIDYLHRHGIIHGNLKPQNILITIDSDEPVAKITDFSIGKVVAFADNPSTASRMASRYWAPEQFNPETYGFNGSIAANADLWSFGLLVYEILFCESPHDQWTEPIRTDLELTYILSRLRSTTVPGKYSEIIRRCLVKKANQRAQNSSELIAVLEDLPLPEHQQEMEQEPADAGQEDTQVVHRRLLILDEDNDLKLQQPIVSSIDSDRLQKKFARDQHKPLQTNSITKTILLTSSVILLIVAFISYGFLSEINRPVERILPELTHPAPVAPAPELWRPELILVRGGRFGMGAETTNSANSDNPLHEVIVKDFFLGKFEITVDQFRHFIAETGFRTTAELRGASQIFVDGNWTRADGIDWRYDAKGDTIIGAARQKLPVVHVSWTDAIAYCNWLSRKTNDVYRLLTEAEWEFAANGGNTLKSFRYSGSDTISQVAWYQKNADGGPHFIGTKKPNDLGIFDMSGNVLEWCFDWYGKDYYNSQYIDNPRGPVSPGKDSLKVLRGGAWAYQEKFVSNAHRTKLRYNIVGGGTGFRVARLVK